MPKRQFPYDQFTEISASRLDEWLRAVVVRSSAKPSAYWQAMDGFRLNFMSCGSVLEKKLDFQKNQHGNTVGRKGAKRDRECFDFLSDNRWAGVG